MLKEARVTQPVGLCSRSWPWLSPPAPGALYDPAQTVETSRASASSLGQPQPRGSRLSSRTSWRLKAVAWSHSCPVVTVPSRAGQVARETRQATDQVDPHPEPLAALAPEGTVPGRRALRRPLPCPRVPRPPRPQPTQGSALHRGLGGPGAASVGVSKASVSPSAEGTHAHDCETAQGSESGAQIEGSRAHDRPGAQRRAGAWFTLPTCRAGTCRASGHASTSV